MIQSQHSQFVYYIPPGTWMHKKTWVGGWYWVDEAEQFCDEAYATEKEAIDALNDYAAKLNEWASKQ